MAAAQPCLPKIRLIFPNRLKCQGSALSPTLGWFHGAGEIRIGGSHEAKGGCRDTGCSNRSECDRGLDGRGVAEAVPSRGCRHRRGDGVAGNFWGIWGVDQHGIMASGVS